MTKLLSANSLYLILVFIVPGFIALSVRSQFITGRIPSENKASLLSYLTISVIYGALVLPVVDPALIQDSRLVWFGVVFVGPIFLGQYPERPCSPFPQSVWSLSCPRHTDRLGLEVQRYGRTVGSCDTERWDPFCRLLRCTIFRFF